MTGASSKLDRATRASTKPASGLGHTAGIPSAVEAEFDRLEHLAKTYRRAQLTAEERLCREQANASGWKKRAQYLEGKLAAAPPAVPYEELSIYHGQQVAVTFKDTADAFAFFNEVKDRGVCAQGMETREGGDAKQAPGDSLTARPEGMRP